ncbi:hypothetical protein EMIT019CA3_70018 [Bacillus pseudomycoides]
MFQDSRKYVSYLSIPSLHFLSISSLYDKKGMMRANLCELLVNIQKKVLFYYTHEYNSENHCFVFSK